VVGGIGLPHEARLSPETQNSREAARLIYLKGKEAEFRMAGASMLGIGPHFGRRPDDVCARGHAEGAEQPRRARFGVQFSMLAWVPRIRSR
jgi:hypothetical protein